MLGPRYIKAVARIVTFNIDANISDGWAFSQASHDGNFEDGMMFLEEILTTADDNESNRFVDVTLE